MISTPDLVLKSAQDKSWQKDYLVVGSNATST